MGATGRRVVLLVVAAVVGVAAVRTVAVATRVDLPWLRQHASFGAAWSPDGRRLAFTSGRLVMTTGWRPTL